MVGVLLALASSLSWGTGDFLGGSASRRHGVLRVLVCSQGILLVLLWLAVAILASAGTIGVDARALGIGALGGAAGVVALAAFYRALAIGPMALVPPVAAAGVVLPVAVGLAGGDAPGAKVLVGIVVAIAGVVLASIGEGAPVPGAAPAHRVRAGTIGLCLVAAVGFAIVFVAIDAAAGDSIGSALVATAGVRAGSCAVLALVVIASRRNVVSQLGSRELASFALIGVLDTGANLLFAMATAVGQLEVVAVLGSLYPAVTSALACLVLGERLGRLQVVGIAVAMLGVALLA